MLSMHSFCTEMREKLSACIIGWVQAVGAGTSVDKMWCCSKDKNVHEITEQYAKIKRRKAKF